MNIETYMDGGDGMKKGLFAAGLLCAVVLAGCGHSAPPVIETLAVEPAFTAVEAAGDWYYAENGTIFKQAKNDETPTALAALPVKEQGQTELQVAGANLYFSCDEHALYRIPIGGGQPEMLLDTRQIEDMVGESIHS